MHLLTNGGESFPAGKVEQAGKSTVSIRGRTEEGVRSQRAIMELLSLHRHRLSIIATSVSAAE